MVIEFGRWRLVPVDKFNWELCHLHMATRGKNAGTEKWNRLGRYYSFNTIDMAFRFAADQEMREKDADAVRDIADALKEYESIIVSFMRELRAVKDGVMQ